MGCHTWFYVKIESLSKKDLNFLKQETFRGVKSWCEYPTFKEWKDMYAELAEDMEDYAEYAKDHDDMRKYNLCMKERRKYLNPPKKKWRKYSYNKKRILKKLTARSLSRSELIRVIINAKEFIFCKNPFPDRKGWYCDKVFGYCDNFRIYDYDAEPWLCYDDFVKYLEEHPDKKVNVLEYNKETNKFERREDSIEQAKSTVKEFFEKYPDGYIELG